MDPADAERVADIFAESDAGTLPRRIGVTRRSLFSFHGLYFHLIEAERDIGPALAVHRDDPDFLDINRRLSAYITAYDPQTWRGPRDAMAREFYTWQAS
ncbi:polyketide synthase [Carbonactinospora thermoautotrophica]|uniref:Polyketide synthase n=2 Tax=Carbonactinospora thermoautotrophica TaxID=1469144 RepID=A0A132N3Y0_9ACTN|nr:polyketide synthase [Carbonactinospora thermoautotrophica]KWX09526.1 polyketide synthase [Carbonactinospora thermoautotrophica]